MNGKYVRWAKVWHGNNGKSTYCGRVIPKDAECTNQQPPRLFACANCFDI